MLQLKPSIPVLVLKDGEWLPGQAIGWFDYDKEEDLIWLISFDKGGECWMIRNADIRLKANYTFGRKPS